MGIRHVILLGLCFSMVNCKSKSEDAPPPQPNPVEIKYFTESETQNLTNEASADIGVMINLEDAKDFQNEYKYKRVLQLLRKYRADIIKVQANIERIVIFNGISSIEESSGKTILKISYHITETELKKLIQDGVTKFTQEIILLKELKNSIPNLEVVDQVGVNSMNVAMIKEKLTQLGKDIVFSQDSSFKVLEIGETFALTNSGMVINVNATYPEIVSIVREAIEMRLKWTVETLPLLATLGLDLVVQPGVFTPYEINQVHALIKRDGVLIKSQLGNFKKIMVGKRWDFNLDKGILLLNFAATSSEIRDKLISMNTRPDEFNFDTISLAISGMVAEKGHTLSEGTIIDLPRNPLSFELLKSNMELFSKEAFISNLKKLNVRRLHIYTDVTRFVYGTKVLFLQMPSNQDLLGMLNQEVINNEMFLLRTDIVALGLKQGAQVTIEIERASAATLEELKALKSWLSEGASEPLIQKAKINQITVSRRNGPTAVKTSELILNLDDFDPSKMSVIMASPKKP